MSILKKLTVIVAVFNLKKMDIILVNINSTIMTNSGLAIIDPYLKKNGFRSMVINSSEIEMYLDKADIFGISVMDHTFVAAQELTRLLKNKTVIWGGWTTTALPEYILKENPGVDYAILQEGEKRLVNLLKSFKQPEFFDGIDGIAYRDDKNKIIIRPPCEFVDMNELPISNDLAVLGDIVFIEVSRGCYGGCDYCQEEIKMRFKNTHKIVKEIGYWYNRGYRTFHLGNANSISKGSLLRKLLSELEKKGKGLSINIRLVGRPEDVVRNRDVITQIFKSKTVHLNTVTVGIEANTKHALDLLGRGTNPEINDKAISLLISLREKYSPDTIIQGNMILFSHYDMILDDLVENIKFIGNYGCSRDTISPQLHGLAGTPIWHNMKTMGFKESKKLGLRVFDYPFSDKDVDKLYKKLVHGLIKKIVRGANEKNGNKITDSDRISLTVQVHDKFMEFYNSGDPRKAVMEFINA